VHQRGATRKRLLAAAARAPSPFFSALRPPPPSCRLNGPFVLIILRDTETHHIDQTNTRRHAINPTAAGKDSSSSQTAKQPSPRLNDDAAQRRRAHGRPRGRSSAAAAEAAAGAHARWIAVVAAGAFGAWAGASKKSCPPATSLVRARLFFVVAPPHRARAQGDRWDDEPTERAPHPQTTTTPKTQKPNSSPPPPRPRSSKTRRRRRRHPPCSSASAASATSRSASASP